MIKYFLIFILLLINSSIKCLATPVNISGTVKNEQQEPLIFATIILKGTNKQFINITDEKGSFIFNGIKPGFYTITVTFIGYNTSVHEIDVKNSVVLNFDLKPNIALLNEVVVTATESKGITSSSRIDKQAMVHLQPSSFTDVLELLPGGISKNPVMGRVNFIKLREADVSSSSTDDKYTMSSLGTSFLIDGVPINTSANMQYVSGSTTNHSEINGRNTVNKGVDMRTLSTDQIESIEIIRGIASAEHGDLTSGLIKINRKQGLSKFEARFKADESSKLFALNKGFGNKDQSLNLNIDFLNAKPDVRNNLENYKRLTSSIRFNKLYKKQDYTLKLSSSFDYSTSIDDVKKDADNDYKDVDKFKSSFNKFSISNRLEWDFKQSLFKQLLIHGAFNAQFDKIKRTNYVSLSQDILLHDSMVEGEFDGFYLPYTYTSYLEVDGKPLTAFLKTMGTFMFSVKRITNKIKVGANWQWTKNYGKGHIYDVTRPPFINLTTRPRPYYDIPAGSDLSFFIEDETKIPIATHQIRLVGGIRSTTMLNLSSDYKLHGKLFFDPRINAQWILPSFNLWNNDMKINLSGGIGWHTKLPTLTHLYPNKKYVDIIQLNYFHINPNFRRINFVTYIVDPTNYDLDAARNKKWEVRTDLEYRQNRLSITYFNENLSSGFQSYSYFKPYAYKKYDYSKVDHNNLDAPPPLADMPYEVKKTFERIMSTNNSVTILKQGIEFQYTSPRISLLKTRLTLNGAWFKTVYKNNLPIYYQPTIVVDNERYEYVGLYEYDDGWERQQFNTNFMFDTYINTLDLEFSTNIQCMWFVKRDQLVNNGFPICYVDLNGIEHNYTEADSQDKYLKHLIRNTVRSFYAIPLALYVNFKATKLFANRYRISLFVNKILDYLPEYRQNGILVRRSVAPYFGMEINLTI